MAGDEQILIRDEHRYCAHPHMAVLASGAWLLVANRAPRRPVTMHPPQDPEFVNVMIRSLDEGRTWSPATPVPGFGWTGTECAGLTALPDGTVLLNQWRFRWYPYTAPPDPAVEPLVKGPLALMCALMASSEIAPERRSVAGDAEALMPWIRGGGTLAVHRSSDDGLTWSPGEPIDTAGFSGGYGMRGAAVLPDGDILLPLSDVPLYERVFIVRSRDGGRSWGKPEPVAAIPGLAFEEPAPLVLRDGSILMLLRENVSRMLYQVRSVDGGARWSRPEPTGIDCYPAHVLALADGRVAAVTGRRHPPYGIAIFCSSDAGRSWNVAEPLAVRTGLPSKDLGYPTAVQRGDGSLFVAYYYRDASGVTGVHAVSVGV